jgi:4-diphosphocytidyl-2-C-methyl-D-erythritol kinase
MNFPARADPPVDRLHGLPAPAKLNLFLHVTGRRPDGYHLLQSVFMLIDWCDHIDLDLRHDGRIVRIDQHAVDLPTEDLCVRAARALQAATGCPLGTTIRLDKRLPAEAGMGGGSSDAATCLIGLNHL